MSHPTTATAEVLLEHREFVLKLAKTLVHDPQAAEDLAQDTWLAVLRSPPRSLHSPRAWLSRIVRNRAANQRRGSSRRAQREEAAAQPEAQASAAELVERLAVQQEVVEAVLSLREPYRSAVLMRFYEELPPREIAARLGVPVETVRTRLKRASQELRTTLDTNHGGERRDWAMGLALLLRDYGVEVEGAAASSGWALTLGSLLMVSVGGLVVWRLWPAPEVTVPHVSTTANLRSEPVEAASISALPESAEDSTRSAAGAPDAPGPPAALDPPAMQAALVLDAETLEPVHEITAEFSEYTAEVADQGTFEFPASEDPGSVRFLDGPDRVRIAARLAEQQAAAGNNTAGNNREPLTWSLDLGPSFTLVDNRPAGLSYDDCRAYLFMPQGARLLYKSPGRLIRTGQDFGGIYAGVPWVRFAIPDESGGIVWGAFSEYIVVLDDLAGFWRAQSWVQRIPGLNPDPLELTWSARGRVQVQARYADGRPAVGVQLRLIFSENREYFLTNTPGPDGTFQRTSPTAGFLDFFERTDAEGQVEYLWQKPGLHRLTVVSLDSRAERQELEVKPHETTVVEVLVEPVPTFSVSGEVRCQSGQAPASGWSARVTSTTDANLRFQVLLELEEDPDATKRTFRIDSIPSGEWTLGLFSPHLHQVLPASVDFNSGQEGLEFEIVDIGQAAEFALEFIDASTGEPVDGVKINHTPNRYDLGPDEATSRESVFYADGLLDSGELLFDSAPAIGRFYWITTHKEYMGSWGDETAFEPVGQPSDLGAEPTGEPRRLARVYLQPRRTLSFLFVTLDETGAAHPIEGVTLTASKTLFGQLSNHVGMSNDEGRIAFEPLYDFGQLHLGTPFEVVDWQGFEDGRPTEILDEYRVVVSSQE